MDQRETLWTLFVAEELQVCENAKGFFKRNKSKFNDLGGTEATRNQFPYQVLLFVEVNDDQSVCGGSILSTAFVLSAAHCFNSFTSADVLAGVHNWQTDDPTYELKVFPNDVIVHSQYNRQSLVNDIALVKLARRPLTLSAAIAVIPLIPRAMENTNLTGTLGRIAGW